MFSLSAGVGQSASEKQSVKTEWVSFRRDNPRKSFTVFHSSNSNSQQIELIKFCDDDLFRLFVYERLVAIQVDHIPESPFLKRSVFNLRIFILSIEDEIISIRD